MSEVNVYQVFHHDLEGGYEGSERDVDVVLKSDYDTLHAENTELKSRLLVFEGMTFSESKEIAELKAENVQILELARTLDLYTVHTTNCRFAERMKDCKCGLSEHRETLKKVGV